MKKIMLVTLLCCAAHGWGQTFLCSAPTVTPSPTSTSVSINCVGYALGTFTGQWSTGTVAIGFWQAKSLTITDDHAANNISNQILADIGNQVLPFNEPSTIGVLTLAVDLNQLVSTVRLSGTFHVDNSYQQCPGLIGFCYFTASATIAGTPL